MRRLRTILVLLVVLWCTSILWMIVVYTVTFMSETSYIQSGLIARLNAKQILLGTPFFADDEWEIGVGSRIFRDCPVDNCYITNELSRYYTSDAVLFHIHNLEWYPQFQRPEHQRWVFFMLESAAYSRNFIYQHGLWRSAFNWTMTFRRDSDLSIPYGTVSRTPKTPARDHMTIARSKTKLVAWFASNCETNSRREEYVRELSNYVNVDMYGRCGNLTCDRDYIHGDTHCHSLINSTYLFYLSFENSLCPEYITEKFFKILEMDVVPIVRGGVTDDYEKIADKRWFIDAKGFASPKDLANHLLYLRDNLGEYVKYFEGKENYKVTTYYGLRKLPQWCDLCAKLHNDKEPRKIADNIANWWNADQCRYPTDITWNTTQEYIDWI